MPATAAKTFTLRRWGTDDVCCPVHFTPQGDTVLVVDATPLDRRQWVMPLAKARAYWQQLLDCGFERAE